MSDRPPNSVESQSLDSLLIRELPGITQVAKHLFLEVCPFVT
jgi:hypothetical protein